MLILLLLTIVSLISFVALPKVLFFATYNDLILKSAQLLQASMLRDYKYTDLLLAHLVILFLFLGKYVYVIFMRKKSIGRAGSGFKPMFLPGPNVFPKHILEKIKYTLRELDIDYQFISGEHNNRILYCAFKIQKMRQLTNLQGYFLKNPEIYSMRITRSRMYKSIVEIETGYAPENHVEVYDSVVWRCNRKQVFMTLGKDARNNIFIEKLSSISIFGKAKSGKTNLLRQIASSLAQQKHDMRTFLPNKFADLARDNTVIYDNIASLQYHISGGKNNIILIDDVDENLEAFKKLMQTSRGAYYIVSTNIVYDDFMKHAFSRKVIFKLNDSLEKQFLSTRDLPNEGLLDFDDYYYVTPKSTFRITSAREKLHQPD